MSKIKQEASLDSLSDSIFPSPDISPIEGEVVVEKTHPVEVTPTIAKTYEDFSADDLYTYAGLDCIATSTVLKEIFPTLTEVRTYTYSKNNQRVLGKAPSIITSINDVEMKAFEYILDLEINGIQYDISKNREYHNRMVEEISFLEDRIFTSIGKRVNLDSGTIVAELLYLNMGMVAPKATKSGDDSTDGEALLMLAGLPIDGSCYVAPDPSKQFLADMAKRKDISSVHNTFIKTYIEDFVKRDGRVHPSYNLHGTSSFRITGSDPNLTQLPRPKHGYNVRECYTVAPGHIFIAADWSSAEVKILGALSRDPSLLRAIQDGLDFHSYSASQMAGVPCEQFIEAIENKSHADYKKYKLLRQRAKALTFGILI